MRGGIIGWKVGQIDRDKQNNIYRQHRQIDYFERQTYRLADRYTDRQTKQKER